MGLGMSGKFLRIAGLGAALFILWHPAFARAQSIQMLPPMPYNAAGTPGALCPGNRTVVVGKLIKGCASGEIGLG